MIRVNLLGGGVGPVQAKAWVPAEQKSALVGLAMLMVTGVAVGGWWYYISYQRAATEEGILKAEARIEQLKDAMKLLETVRSQKAELEERLSLIDRLRAAKHAPVRMLDLLNASIPDGLWLMEVKQSSQSVTLEGRAMSQTAVSDYAKALQDSGFFKMPVEVVMTLMETVDETEVYRFLLKGTPVAASPVAPPPNTSGVVILPTAGKSGV